MKAKYHKGKRIDNWVDFIMGIRLGCRFYWNHKCQHPAWLANMQLRTLLNAVRKGIIFEAIPNADSPETQKVKRIPGSNPTARYP